MTDAYLSENVGSSTFKLLFFVEAVGTLVQRDNGASYSSSVLVNTVLARTSEFVRL